MRYASFAILFVALVVVAGCGSPDEPAGLSDNGSAPPVKEGEHGHRAGAMGGLIVPIGRDNYHAEAVFEKNGVLRLYTLGQDEARILAVESQTLTAFAKPEGGTEASEFAVKPEPRADDAQGKTSRFTGTLPRELWGKRVEVTLPTVRINGERFRVGFKSAGEAGHKEMAMPAKVSSEKERKLFLEAGGKYTAADIEANKRQTPSQKFVDFVAEHDADPQPGERICPVTATKANDQCTWVIDGQTYYFCCPPCVTDFVKTAKSRPEKVKQSGEYRQPAKPAEATLKAKPEVVDKKVAAGTTVITVEDMDCPSCAKKIVAKLKAVAGVAKAVADVDASTLTVFAKDKASPSPRAIWEAIEKAGFKPTKLEGPAGSFTVLPKQ